MMVLYKHVIPDDTGVSTGCDPRLVIHKRTLTPQACYVALTGNVTLTFYHLRLLSEPLPLRLLSVPLLRRLPETRCNCLSDRNRCQTFCASHSRWGCGCQTHPTASAAHPPAASEHPPKSAAVAVSLNPAQHHTARPAVSEHTGLAASRRKPRAAAAAVVGTAGSAAGRKLGLRRRLV